MKKVNSIVKCEKCGKKEYANFEECLRKGWPICHGYTMTLVRIKANIDKAVGNIVKDSISRVGG